MRGAFSILVLTLLFAACSAGEPDPSASDTVRKRAPAPAGPWQLVYATEAEGRGGLDVYVVTVPDGKPEPRRRAARPQRLQPVCVD